MILRGAHTIRSKPWLAALAGVMLSACSAPPFLPPTPTALPLPVPPSAESVALAAYYADLQHTMRLRGLLREDDMASAAINGRILAENFEAIALHDEYQPGPNGFVRQQSPSSLRRWNIPVRMSVAFGETVALDKRSEDSAFVAQYAAQLAEVTGHPITMTDIRPNYLILILGEDDREKAAQSIQSFVPGIDDNTIRNFVDLPRSILCMVYAFPQSQNDPSYSRAIAVIRAEHPDLMRRSCIHEELAQGLGLANDSPRARPSIFNDDEEFGFLTRHDKLLLKLLYDPRLSVGMTADQARPHIRQIAEELAG